MRIALEILAGWLALSIVLGLVIGPMLRRLGKFQEHHDDHAS